MAVQLLTPYQADRMLLAYNNNIVRFKSNTVGTPLNATITGFGFVAVLYPHPNGEFYFNFKEYIIAELNKYNFADMNLGIDLTAGDYQKSVDDGYCKSDNIEIKIKFVNPATPEDVNYFAYTFILGVEQLTDRFSETFSTNNLFNMLTPLQENGKAYIKYWKGLPFEVSTFSSLNYTPPTGLNPIDFYILGSINIALNGGVSNATVQVPNTGRTNALWFSDGLNNLIPFDCDFIYSTVLNATIEQIKNNCGTYVKFRNKYGRWNYWLFESGKYETRSTKSIGELLNDFKDVRETNAPLIQLGRTADSTIKVQADKLDYRNKLILEQIIDSPKIYLFTGKPNHIAKETDWLEIALKTNSFVVENPKKKLYKYTIEFDIPNRYTQTL